MGEAHVSSAYAHCLHSPKPRHANACAATGFWGSGAASAIQIMNASVLRFFYTMALSQIST
jgi:hypothetical protein